MFIGMGSITNATVANVASYVGKIVSIKTPDRSLGWGKFTTVADPLSVEIVKEDGSSHAPPIIWSIPLADIRAMWDPSTEQNPENLLVTGPGTVQASAFPPWALPAGVIALAALLAWQSGLLASFGIGAKRKSRKSRRSRGGRSKR